MADRESREAEAREEELRRVRQRRSLFAGPDEREPGDDDNQTEDDE